MICPNCGYTNQPSNRFCVRCGIDTAAHRPAGPEPAPATGMPDLPPTDTPPPAPAPAPASPAAGAPPSPAIPPPAPPSPWGIAAPPPAAPPPSAVPGPPPGPPPYPPPGAPSYPPPGPPNPFAPPATAPAGYPQWGYGQYPPPYPPSGPWAPQKTNGLAVAALVLGIVGWIPCGVGSVLAVIFGFVSQAQIRDSQGRQSGTGLAKAGIILGFVGIALIAFFFVVGAISGSNQS